jgi:hypothetical protein
MLDTITADTSPLHPNPRSRHETFKTHAARLVVRIARHTDKLGAELVVVPLFGKGEGLYMTLDASIWDAGRAAGWPAVWVGGTAPGSTKIYAATGRQPLSPGGRLIWMSRVITQAKRGEVASFKDGNPMNLRLSNLHKGRGSRSFRDEVIEERELTARTCPVPPHHLPLPLFRLQACRPSLSKVRRHFLRRCRARPWASVSESWATAFVRATTTFGRRRG